MKIGSEREKLPVVDWYTVPSAAINEPPGKSITTLDLERSVPLIYFV